LKDNPSIGVTITRPNGEIVSEGSSVNVNRSARDEVWNIEKGGVWEGTWSIDLTGSGRVLFAYEPIPDVFTVNRISPPSNFTKACTPIDLALTIVDSEGNSISDNITDFSLKVETPDGRIAPFGSIVAENDIFSQSYDDTCIEGVYKLSGIFRISDVAGAGTILEWHWNDTIMAVLDPYLQVVSPVDGSYHANEAIPLQVDIKVGDRLDEASATQNPPVIANVYQSTNLVAGPYTLNYDGGLGTARMKNEIPPNILAVGDYTIEFSLELPGNPIPDVRRSEFSVTEPGSTPAAAPTITAPAAPSPTSTPEPETEPPSGAMIAGILGGLALLGTVGGAVWWYSQLSPMLRLMLSDFAGIDHHVGTKLGGKLAQTLSFVTGSGQPVKLRFSPGQSIEGLPTTQMTLLNDLDPDTRVGVDNDMPLYQKGESTLITSQSQKLTIGDESFDITTF